MFSISEKVVAVVFGVGILFPAIYGSLPPPPEVIEMLNSGIRVKDISPDPKQVFVLALLVIIPLGLIVQWWRWWLRVIGWSIWGFVVVVLLFGF